MRHIFFSSLLQKSGHAFFTSHTLPNFISFFRFLKYIYLKIIILSFVSVEMNYETIQAIRRQILAGTIRAPERVLNVNPLKERRKRKAPHRDTLHVDGEDGWDEGAFIDDFYEDDVDVSPDYFRECEELITTFYKNQDMPRHVSNCPLFHGSVHSAKDLARFLLSFKGRHLKIGDGILANVVAMMATFLPPDNLFKKWLPDNTSTYLLLKTLDNMASYETNLRCLKIDVCTNKCMGYYADRSELHFCSLCGESRWKLCVPACYGEGDVKLCRHIQRPRHVVYYNVVQDRLVKLLKSDLKNLFNYQDHRGGKWLHIHDDY